ncbi:homeobox protein OTX1-like [Liolophura sinensis]|uniref:homeobox protein OTX1-like n=1 Tax=Liolophura sinensis TaxID=3198878 RepID=UPI003158E2C3
MVPYSSHTDSAGPSIPISVGSCSALSVSDNSCRDLSASDSSSGSLSASDGSSSACSASDSSRSAFPAIAITLAVAPVRPAHVSCHSKYMDSIPNGHKVPNPKSPGSYWEAVGHTTPDDGDGYNSFGEMDSDGDGKTNGAELGDPNCEWSPGSTPAGPATGHPGYRDSTGGGDGGFHGISLPQPESTTESEHHGHECKEHHHSHEKDKHHSHEKDKHHSHEKDKHHCEH